MSSGFYLSFIRHHRIIPKEYKFDYRFFWSYFDLDELDHLNKEHFYFSRNKWNILSFYDGDHFDFGHGDIKKNLIQFLNNNGVTESIKSIHLLTNPRLFGYTFNPVSYFIIEGEKNPYLVIEIGNTFSESKPYFVSSKNLSSDGWDYRTKKKFYISPFTSVKNDLHFRMKKEGRFLKINIDDYREDGQLEIKTNYQGSFIPWSTRQVFKLIFQFPFLTFRIIFSIHWHALILYLKRIPFYGKKDFSDEQTDLFKFDGKSFKNSKDASKA